MVIYEHVLNLLSATRKMGIKMAQWFKLLSITQEVPGSTPGSALFLSQKIIDKCNLVKWHLAFVLWSIDAKISYLQGRRYFIGLWTYKPRAWIVLLAYWLSRSAWLVNRRYGVQILGVPVIKVRETAISARYTNLWIRIWLNWNKGPPTHT